MKKLLTAVITTVLLIGASSMANAQPLDIKGIKIGDTQKEHIKRHKGETLAGYDLKSFYTMTESKESNKISYVIVTLDSDHYQVVRDAFFTKFGKDNWICKTSKLKNAFGAEFVQERCSIFEGTISSITLSRFNDKVSEMAVEMIKPDKGFSEKQNKKAAKDL